MQIKNIIKLICKSFLWLRTFILIKCDPVAYARSIGVKVGDDVRLIGIHGGTFGSEPYLIEIGNHVTITSKVQFVNHDGGVWVLRDREPDIDVFGKILIGNNVFVGFGTIILPNVKIGDNVIIAAGSIVTKDIPSNSVAVGSPAKVIKSIDDYYISITSSKMNIRNLPKHKVRDILTNKYMRNNNCVLLFLFITSMINTSCQ